MRASRNNVFQTAQETIRKRAAVARLIEAGPDDPDEPGHDGAAKSGQKNGKSTTLTTGGVSNNNRGSDDDDSDEEEKGGRAGGVGDVSAFGSEDGGTPRLAGIVSYILSQILPYHLLHTLPHILSTNPPTQPSTQLPHILSTNPLNTLGSHYHRYHSQTEICLFRQCQTKGLAHWSPSLRCRVTADDEIGPNTGDRDKGGG